MYDDRLRNEGFNAVEALRNTPESGAIEVSGGRVYTLDDGVGKLELVIFHNYGPDDAAELTSPQATELAPYDVVDGAERITQEAAAQRAAEETARQAAEREATQRREAEARLAERAQAHAREAITSAGPEPSTPPAPAVDPYEEHGAAQLEMIARARQAAEEAGGTNPLFTY